MVHKWETTYQCTIPLNVKVSYVGVHQPQVFSIALLSKDPFTLNESESEREFCLLNGI